MRLPLLAACLAVATLSGCAPPIAAAIVAVLTAFLVVLLLPKVFRVLSARFGS